MVVKVAVVVFKTKSKTDLLKCGPMAVAHRQESKLIPAFWSRE